MGSSPLSRGIRQNPPTTPPPLGDHPRSRGEYSPEQLIRRPVEGSSPLSRGIHSATDQQYIEGGIIPALAGNTPCSWPISPDRPDHPRSRGEYQGPPWDREALEGSSPLSRGILAHNHTDPPVPGIIPALAGNTCSSAASPEQRPDHPRSRGEYNPSILEDWHENGSSPLSRGIPITEDPITVSPRIIPALAGNTRSPVWLPRKCRDHPRSRGEYFLYASVTSSGSGSSPLSRGIRTLPKPNTVVRGIIPALAGNTGSLERCAATRRDHPRSRGEYPHASGGNWPMRGSSPLSRGIPLWRTPNPPEEGIIPALAGNTQTLSRSGEESRDHPRSRGEYSSPAPVGTDRIGSSPLSRGIRVRSARRELLSGIIPALAGNTARNSKTPSHSRDHPRSRGEYNLIVRTPQRTQGSSPLSRGIHLLTRDFISRTCRILGTPSSHVSASRSHSPRVCDGHPPGGVGRLARHLKDLDGPSGSAPRSRLVPMDHPMSGRTYLARS